MYFLLNMGIFQQSLCELKPEGTWRTIPVSKWLITMVSKSPKWGYSPYKWPKWLVNGLFLHHGNPFLIISYFLDQDFEDFEGLGPFCGIQETHEEPGPVVG